LNNIFLSKYRNKYIKKNQSAKIVKNQKKKKKKKREKEKERKKKQHQPSKLNMIKNCIF